MAHANVLTLFQNNARGRALSASVQDLAGKAHALSDNVVRNGNALGPNAAQAKSQADDLVAKVEHVVELWGRVRDESFRQAVIATADTAAFATSLGALGLLIALVAPPLGGAVAAAAGATKLFASGARKVTDQADGLLDDGRQRDGNHPGTAADPGTDRDPGTGGGTDGCTSFGTEFGAIHGTVVPQPERGSPAAARDYDEFEGGLGCDGGLPEM
jgi:hypothetical protein